MRTVGECSLLRHSREFELPILILNTAPGTGITFSGADQILMQIYFIEREFNNKFKENEINDAWGFILM
jgi:hypothetical protein